VPRILGIDPGSRITGYGIIETGARGFVYITSGSVHADSGAFPARLKRIYEGIQHIVGQYSPDELSIEQVFMHRNADSALKLGQARGAAICAGLADNLPVYEYSARQVKLAMVGKGSADKHQVKTMVRVLLRLQGNIQTDASDALGVALCHAHHRQTEIRLKEATG